VVVLDIADDISSKYNKISKSKGQVDQRSLRKMRERKTIDLKSSKAVLEGLTSKQWDFETGVRGKESKNS